jgi:tripartite-type tricarboxylate transporter receptor subunit TctC
MAIGFRRIACCLVVLLALAAFAPCQSFAQDYPNRPIRLITGPAGGVADIRARWVAERLNTALGKTIVVDNRGGAGGNIGMELAAKSPKDGYTLIIVHQGTLALNPHIYKRVGYGTRVLGTHHPRRRDPSRLIVRHCAHTCAKSRSNALSVCYWSSLCRFSTEFRWEKGTIDVDQT